MVGSMDPVGTSFQSATADRKGARIAKAMAKETAQPRRVRSRVGLEGVVHAGVAGMGMGVSRVLPAHWAPLPASFSALGRLLTRSRTLPPLPGIPERPIVPRG